MAKLNTDDLRKLAQLLREQATKTAEDKTARCAQIIKAASGLALLKKKLRGDQ
jgi:hypothetical protein